MTQRPEAPHPLSRRGPRPLMLHLGLAWLKPGGSCAALLNWNNNWLNMLSGSAPPDPQALISLFEAAWQQDRQLIAGIAAYRRADYVRRVSEKPVIWSEGETRVLDYGGHGPAVLFVPSLVNRAYILDLMEDGSMLRWLATQNMRPYLLDWGWPGEAERHFSLTDYIAGRLERALAALAGPVILAGYCMGGLLALAAALRAQMGGRKVVGLALLATPWDFHAGDAEAAQRLAASLPFMEPALQFSNSLPIDMLNTLFTLIDPSGVAEKYRDFAGQDPASPRARRFVAMEDWLADGVPLGAAVAREALGGWYGANSTARLHWRVAGLAVDPGALEMPCFCAIPARDRVVPAKSAHALARALRNVMVLEPSAGHIGMVAGTHAQSALWAPFSAWVQGLSNG